MDQADESGETHYQADGENIIVLQSWLNQLLLIVAGLVGTALLLTLTYRYPDQTIIQIPLGESSVGLPFLAIFPIALFGRVAFLIYNVRLVLTPEYLIHVAGILAWKESSIRLDYRKIQEIQIDQTIIQRIFDLGDVIVTPIATGLESTITMPGVKSPRALKDILRLRGKSDEDIVAELTNS